jgi:deoxycytidine triphosphate deaminase
MEKTKMSLGGFLSGTALLQALSKSNHIFRNESWIIRNVRGAGYDLRLAGDCLVYPASSGERQYSDVDNGAPEINRFTLRPGDSALISTIEKVCFDLDVAGMVGPKFSWASKGLLMLNGNAVHPGFGRRLDPESGHWLPEDDVRLHFIVTNIGPDDITLRTGDPIAHLQVYSVDPTPSMAYPNNRSFAQLRDGLFHGGSIYFRTIQDLRDEVKNLKSKVGNVEQQTITHETAIGRMTDVTSLIIVLGVFLVSSALLGFVLTALVSIFEKLPAHLSGAREALIAILSSLYGLSSVAGLALVVLVVWPITRRMAQKKSLS